MKQPMADAPAAEWLVYGDALQIAGDPRGELIGLVHAVTEGRATAEQRDAHIARHAEALLGGAAKHLEAYWLDWHYCVLDRIEVRVKLGADPVALVDAILRSPAASDVRELALVGLPDPAQPKQAIDLTRAMALIPDLVPPSLRRFSFVDQRAENASMLVATYFDPQPNLVKFGSFAFFFSIAEDLRIVTADSHQLDLAKIDAPFLRHFALECLRFADWDIADTMCDRLAAGSWPQLESFACRLVETWGANIPLEDNPYVSIYKSRWTEEDEDGEVHDRYEEADQGECEGIDWNVLAALLSNLGKGPLRRLALTSFQTPRSLLQALADAKLPADLELDLSDSALQVADLDWMLGNPKLLKPIKKLVIHRVAVSEADLAKTVARFERKGVVVEGSPGGREARYRFVVGQE